MAIYVALCPSWKMKKIEDFMEQMKLLLCSFHLIAINISLFMLSYYILGSSFIISLELWSSIPPEAVCFVYSYRIVQILLLTVTRKY